MQTSDTPTDNYSEADKALYWAMVADHVIERDPELERQFETGL